MHQNLKKEVLRVVPWFMISFFELPLDVVQYKFTCGLLDLSCERYVIRKTPVNDFTDFGCNLPHILSNNGATEVNPLRISSTSFLHAGFDIKFAFTTDKVIRLPLDGRTSHVHDVTPCGSIMLPDSAVRVEPHFVAVKEKITLLSRNNRSKQIGLG